ncbi:MAG TPA: DUF5134 domain-containing protein [Microbacterium sp.]|uniref:DUF5134 domain-containing protein n=1 Tax=Microbacterium sp. UBA1097 TaxID=1946941 RepID=UPI000E9F13EC|nr:DUF5134 domain-containing protein [Microbacterium sp. UBA1097]HAJ17455.1 DUF5134 domain-containing protein [Microbacterium sp.]HBS09963.1 DUF5134 domain-containing protein [Microbacterium sp.]HBS75058.1 DUF5134 domain-containing protein [Microbacterium sp.]HBU41624.1 DUF5134 domain-containing protein [Microbacterium sp.]
MIGSPWNLILTLAFAFTGLVCAFDLAGRLGRIRRKQARFGGEILIDLNHLLMSAAMIWMAWSMESEFALWAQAGLFTVLTIALLPSIRRGETAAQRVDLVGHVLLNAAMVWMLAAMPLLMAGMGMSHAPEAGMTTGHETVADGGLTLMSTPAWADAINACFVVLSVAAFGWWAYRFIASRHHRLHVACHATMAAGMAAMLLLMNG